MVRARAAAALAASAVILAVSACNSSSSSSSSSSTASAGALQNDFTTLARTIAPSVVEVATPVDLGSGIVYDNKGDIVTNAHVVGTATSFTVTTSTKQKLSATLVAANTTMDVAVIHTSTKGLTPAKFGDSSKLVVGDIVLAFGNPLGLRGTVTQGIVSAVNRTEQESEQSATGQTTTGPTLSGLIQTSASINPGNSGGALVDLQGQVIGIPTLSVSDATGLGFAIPGNQVTTVANQLISGGR